MHVVTFDPDEDKCRLSVEWGLEASWNDQSNMETRQRENVSNCEQKLLVDVAFASNFFQKKVSLPNFRRQETE